MTDTDDRESGAIGGRGDAWAVLLPPDRYDAERLVHHDTLELTGLATPGATDSAGPRPGDPVAVLVEEPLRLVALGRVARPTAERGEDPDDPQSDPASGTLVITYTRRAFDDPVPAEGLALDGPLSALPGAAYQALAERLGPPPPRRSWLVSVDLPIEAATPAEAVRLFWSYVRDLGPRELPAFVWPTGDELAMQAYVLGVAANQDPEEDD